MTLTLHVPPTAGAPALTLRPWRDADVEAVLAAYEDASLQRWLAAQARTREEAERWVASQHEGWATGLRLGFAITEAGGPPLGHVTLKRRSTAAPEAEAGYWTTNAARGRGIAPRALTRVTEWGFTDLGLARVQLIHAVENEASCRVAQKSSFALAEVYPPHPPKWPGPAHLHVRAAEG
ncbi:GNAT family N-acetyltransferase [Streptomyces sp. NPDC051940]|uniref:GNAT family N-acetyltransferase n=1 Tax=Streptomyces sp. NPDC051940 TaxID=3155675 RepID=UPI00343D239D